MKDFLYKKSWYTVIEIIVAIVISSFIILWLTGLLQKFNSEIFNIQSQTSTFSSLSNFRSDFNNYKFKYTKAINVVDNSSWYDVLLLMNTGSQRWIMVWVVDKTTGSPNYFKLDPVSNYNIFWDKVLWIKELTTTQTQNALSNSGSVYSIVFNDSNLYSDVKVDSFIINAYNSWSVMDISMDILTKFYPSYIWKDKASVVDSDSKYRVNISLAKDVNINAYSSDTGNISIYPGCDSPDIMLGTWQIWAACNVWATKAYTWITITDCWGSSSDCDSAIRNTIWSYFQRWRNTDITATASWVWPVSSETNTKFYYNLSSPYDWLSTPNPNLWWWSISDTATINWQTDNTLRQWPCATWYHVPSAKDWCDAMKLITSSLTCNNSPQANTLVVSTIKLPLAGTRDGSSTNYYYQGSWWAYWSSSPSSTTLTFTPYFNSTTLYPLLWYNRWYGNSIRCIKN